MPLTAGYITRKALIAKRGAEWYDNVFMKRVGPFPPSG